MADFCYQCTAEYFGMQYADLNDMAGLSTAEDDAAERYAAVLCEGCGPMVVDSAGNCRAELTKEGCAKKHGCTK